MGFRSLLRALLSRAPGWVSSGGLLGPSAVGAALVFTMAWGLVGSASALAAGVAASSHESVAVREALSYQVQKPGSVVVGAGDSAGAQSASLGEANQALSTEFSDTWTPKGRPRVTRIFTAPVNFRGSDGSWQPIDDRLVAGLGGFENASNRFSLRLPESLSSSVSLSEEGRSVAFTLAGASSSLATVSGSTASYHEVLPSTDLSYVSGPTGVEEIATLKGTGAPGKLEYALSGSEGLTASQQPDGSIRLTDDQGKTWFTVPAPLAYPASAGPAAARRVPMQISSSGSGWLLTVDVSEGWLREALASGPVVVDPTVYTVGTNTCTITEDTPETGYCAWSSFEVGYDATHKEHHTLMEFNLSEIPSSSLIIHATLGLYLESHSTSNAKNVGLYRVIQPWTSSATWDTYDGTHKWATPGGDYFSGSEAQDATVVDGVGTSTGWYHWYPTKMIQEWINGPSAPHGEGDADYGLIVKDETDNSTQNLLRFASPSASTNQPYLELAYEPRGQGSESRTRCFRRR